MKMRVEAKRDCFKIRKKNEKKIFEMNSFSLRQMDKGIYIYYQYLIINKYLISFFFLIKQKQNKKS